MTRGIWWRRWDLNPRPPAYKGGAPNRLDLSTECLPNSVDRSRIRQYGEELCLPRNPSRMHLLHLS